jgi:hypothetical protein
MDWRCGSSGRVPAMQAWNPEFSPEKKKKEREYVRAGDGAQWKSTCLASTCARCWIPSPLLKKKKKRRYYVELKWQLILQLSGVNLVSYNQFSSDGEHLELIQTPEVKGSVPQDGSRFRFQPRMGSPCSPHFWPADYKFGGSLNPSFGFNYSLWWLRTQNSAILKVINLV